MSEPGAVFAITGFIVSPPLMLAAIIFAIREPGLKFRWLWCIFALVAVSQWGFNFATGASKFVALHGALIGAVATWRDTPPVGWTIKSAFPLGALVVIGLISRRHRKRRQKAAQDTSPT